MSQKALFLTAKQGKFEVGSRHIPKPGQGEILVKAHAVALNPVDWKIASYGFAVETYPAVLGQDTAGVVEEVGAGVTAYAKGDRVITRGVITSNDHASFQQYVLANPDFTTKIPSAMSFDEAASIPVCLDTAATGLFGPDNAKLTSPTDKIGAYKGHSILVLGGSSSVGLYALQAARISGFSTIITTASLTHEAYLKSVGATHVIDRKLSEEQIVARVKEITADSFKIVYDAISEQDTQNMAWALLGPGGHLVITNPPLVKPEAGDDRIATFVYLAPYAPNNAEFSQRWWAALPKWLEDGTIVPNKVEVLSGGLEGVNAGLDRMKANKVSGVKLVVRPQETV